MRVSRGECVCVVATIDSIRHTLDAPALEYVPASQEVHVADELAPVALEYVPATQSVHSEAPAVQTATDSQVIS